MPESHTDGNGVSFNSRIEASAFAGEIRAELKAMDEKIERIDKRTEQMWSNQQRFLGVIAVGAFVVPLLIRVLWP